MFVICNDIYLYIIYDIIYIIYDIIWLDWLSDDKQEQKDFLANVTSVVSVRLQTYYDHIKQQLQQQLEQEEEEEDNTIVCK